MTKKQPSEIGASLISTAFSQHIETLLDTNTDVGDELNDLVKGSKDGALMEEILDESFNKTHEEDGKEFKKLVVKKEKFVEITGDFKDGGLSEETI